MMNAQEWMQRLAQLQQEAWVDAHIVSFAGLVLEGFANMQCVLGHMFPAEIVVSEGKAESSQDGGESKKSGKSHTRPQGAKKAELHRDALIRLVVAWELRTRQERDAANADRNGLNAVARDLVNAAFSADTGLRPKAAEGDGATPYASKDFAHSKAAEVFFRERVAARLNKFDTVFGTKLQELAGAPYDMNDDASIERWGRVWTARTALLVLDWARNKGGLSLRQMSDALVKGVGANGDALPKLFVRNPTLPTSPRDLPLPSNDESEKKRYVQVHAELRTRPFLAQVMECNEARFNERDDATCSLHIAIHALDYVASEQKGSSVHYRGRNIAQIYLVVLADCLHAAKQRGGKTPPKTSDTTMNTTTNTSNAPDHDVSPDETPPVHAANLQRIEKHRRDMGASSRKTGGTRFAVSSDTAVAPGMQLKMLEPTSDPSSKILSFTGRQFRSAVAGSQSRDEELIGTIDLYGWLRLQPEWVDLLCFVRDGDQRTTLPVVLQDSDPEEDDETEDYRVRLVLRKNEHSSITAQQLRGAFKTPTGVMAAVTEQGLGVCLTLEVDLQAS